MEQPQFTTLAILALLNPNIQSRVKIQQLNHLPVIWFSAGTTSINTHEVERYFDVTSKQEYIDQDRGSLYDYFAKPKDQHIPDWHLL